MAAGVGALQADTVNDVGGSLATLSGSQIQIAYNPTDGNGNSSAGTFNYYNNNWVDNTFTTGANSLGYKLNSISVWDQYEQSGGFATGNTITMNIFTPGAGSMLYTGTATVGTAGANANWITYTFSSGPTLSANTLYAYSLDTNNGYSALGLTVGNGSTYGSGSASEQLATFSSGTNTTPAYWTGTDNWGSNPVAAPASLNTGHTDNAEFQVVGTAVPEPASLGLLGAAGLGILLLKRRKSA